MKNSFTIPVSRNRKIKILIFFPLFRYVNGENNIFSNTATFEYRFHSSKSKRDLIYTIINFVQELPYEWPND